MTRRSWIPATALVLSAVMAMIGGVSRDAMAGIVAVSISTGVSLSGEEGSAKGRYATGPATHPQGNVSARYWVRGIVLLLIILLILWLVYRTFTGWKPMIS